LLVLLGSVYRILLSLTSHNATLYAQSVSDELTGLLNRRGFNARLDEELRRTQRKGESLTLLMVDIDDFKRYNDAFGHPAGDTALTTVARVIRTTLRRAADCGSRIGGEEFAILLPETDEPGARAVAERIRRGVERLGIVQGTGTHHPVLTVSVGIASTRVQPVLDGLDLLRHADRVLYEAKSAGRNCVRFQGASHTIAGEPSLAG
jgi:diguanylate cyclase (GGDEF)-like protein